MPVRGPLKGRNELFQAHAEHSAKGPQFHDINAPLAALTLADERLGRSEPAGEVRLCETGPSPRLSEDFEEDRVLGRVDRLFHCVRANATKSDYSRKSNSPKMTIISAREITGDGKGKAFCVRIQRCGPC